MPVAALAWLSPGPLPVTTARGGKDGGLTLVGGMWTGPNAPVSRTWFFHCDTCRKGAEVICISCLLCSKLYLRCTRRNGNWLRISQASTARLPPRCVAPASVVFAVL